MYDLRVTNPTQTDADSAYVFGKARNIVTQGDNTGTPWNAFVINNTIFGPLSAMLDAADITPNGTEEKAGQSQVLSALRQLVQDYAWGDRFVGKFSKGFTYTAEGQVGRHGSNYYVYVGSDPLPKVVTAGTVPSSPDWEVRVFSDHLALSNRNVVGAHDASAISNSNGGNVQEYIDNRTDDYEIVKNVAEVVANAGIKKIRIKSGVYENVTLNALTDLDIIIEKDVIFKVADATNSPALLITGCTGKIQGDIIVDGNKSNNTNTLADGDIGGDTSSLSFVNSTLTYTGNVYCTDSFHDGVCIDRLSGEIVGNINSSTSRRRDVIIGGTTDFKHEGSINSTDNENSHGIRIGSFGGAPNITNTEIGNIRNERSALIGILFEAGIDDIKTGDLVTRSTTNQGVKIEENSGVTTGAITVYESGLFQGVTINNPKKLTSGIITANGCGGLGVIITSATGLTQNAENITIAGISSSGNGEGVSIASNAARPSNTKLVNIGFITTIGNAENGLFIGDNTDDVSIGAIVSHGNNTTSTSAKYDFYVHPSAQNINWSSANYGTGAGQVLDAGASPYRKINEPSARAYVTFTVSGGVVTPNANSKLATVSRAAAGIFIIDWGVVMASDDPVSVTSTSTHRLATIDTRGAGSGSDTRVESFSIATNTREDFSGKVTVSLL